MLNLVFVILLFAIAAGAGRVVLRSIGVDPVDSVDAWAFSLALGLGSLALGTFFLAEIGLLTPRSIALGLFFAAVIGLIEFRRGGLRSIAAIAPRNPLSWAALAGTLFVACSPVADGDALCYHLQVPKIFLNLHQAVFEPDLHETIYPLVTESLYAAALAVRGPTGCRLVQWLFGLALTLCATATARPYLGRRAEWAGAIALLVPAVSNGMSAPLADVSLAALGNAAILAWDRRRDAPGLRPSILVGACAGLAIGVKYPALVLAGLIVITIAFEAFSRSRRRSLVDAFACFATIAIVGGFWYARAYYFTGNPVYPFFRNVFGGSGIDEVLAPIKRPMEVNFFNIITALMPMTLDPDRFDSFSHQLGPVFLCVIPAIFLAGMRRREPIERKLLGLVMLGFAFYWLCLTQRQSTRFILIAVGPWSVATAYVIADRAKRRTIAARLWILLIVALLGFEATWAIARGRRIANVVLGLESSEAYLARVEPTFVVGRWVDQNLPLGARLIGQDHRGFYFPRPYTMELARRRRTGLGTRGESCREIIGQLRKDRFTHLVMCPPVHEGSVEFDPGLGTLLKTWLDYHAPVYRAELADGDGIVRRYEIYDIDATEITLRPNDPDSARGRR